MKNILKIAFIFVASLMLTNCEDNEKSPLSERVNGTFVLIDIANELIDVTQIESSTFGGTLRNPSGNAVSHSFDVRGVFADGTGTEFVEVFSTTTFPAEFLVTVADIATALGQEVSDFPPGTRFDFVGKTTSTDGTVVTSKNLNADLLGEVGMRQAYDLRTFISCPVDEALVEGAYDVTDIAFADFFGETNFVRNVVLGPGAQQVTIVEGEYTTTGGDPMTLDIDFATGIITGGGKDENGNAQVAFAEGVNGLPENTYLVEGGFFFSCAGTFAINTNFLPFNANGHLFGLQKQ